MDREILIEFFASRMQPDNVDPDAWSSYEPLRGKDGHQVTTPGGVPVYVGVATWQEYYRKMAVGEVDALLGLLDMHGLEISLKRV